MNQCYYCDGEYEIEESTAEEHKDMFCSDTCYERWDGPYINEK